MKTILYILITLAILVGGFYAFNNYIYEQKQAPASADFKEAEYIVEGQRITLGEADYFGNEVRTDLNADGREDVIFVLTQQPGGSGTFYYVVAALNTERGYVGSEGLFLGDRIALQTIEKGTGSMVIVNYADRKAGESFAIQPSVGKTLWLKLNTESMAFEQIEPNFEGEADPARMNLLMNKWLWISARSGDGQEIKPRKTDAFAITFSSEKRFSATTDCNQVAGSYATTTGNTIIFSEMISTKMFCEGSQETEFVTLLGNTSAYHFTSKGELVFDLKTGGSMTFR
ncbi:MAG: META domain-containing protein [Patescibacteria group bacterium]